MAAAHTPHTPHTPGSQTPLLQLKLHQIQEQEGKLGEMRLKKGPFDRAVRTLTTNIRESFEEIICENLAAAESVEQQLWRLHYKFIEEFRGRLRKLRAAATAAANLPCKKKGSEEEKFLRVGGQYKCFLDEATGFYHGLIAKLRAKHDLPTDLSSPFSSAGMANCSQRLSKVPSKLAVVALESGFGSKYKRDEQHIRYYVAGNSSNKEELQSCQCVCHRCFIYLGDLARYKELHMVVEGRDADWSVAANYYRQAFTLWPTGGNPHNQLAVLATYTGDNLQAVYHYLYSLAVATPFSTARANVKLLFEKNQQQAALLSTSPEEERAIDLQMAQSFESDAFGASSESHREPGDKPKRLGAGALYELQRRFQVHFISLIGILFTRTGLEEFKEVLSLTLRVSDILLAHDYSLVVSTLALEKSNSAKGQALGVLQLVVTIILSIHNAGNKKKRNQSAFTGSDQSPHVGQATMAAFRFISQLMHHTARAEHPVNSILFPAAVMFCKWLASCPDLIEQIRADEECERIQCSFWKEACILLSRCLKQTGMNDNLEDDSPSLTSHEKRLIRRPLWEDQELQGLVPLASSQFKDMALGRTPLPRGGHTFDQENLVRLQRLIRAMKSLSCLFKVDSPDFDLINTVRKSTFAVCGCNRIHTCKKHQNSQVSEGSERLADGFGEEITQVPHVAKRNGDGQLLSHWENPHFLQRSRREGEGVSNTSSLKEIVLIRSTSCNLANEDLMRANSVHISTSGDVHLVAVVEEHAPEDQRSQPVDTSRGDDFKISGILSEGVQQLETITVEVPEQRLLQIPGKSAIEEAPCNSVLRSLLRVSEKGPDKDESSLGRQALSLGDWVKSRDDSNDQIDATSVAKKRETISLSCKLCASEQAQIEDLSVMSLHLGSVLFGKPTRHSCPPRMSEAFPLAVGERRGQQLHNESPEAFCNKSMTQSYSAFQRGPQVHGVPSEVMEDGVAVSNQRVEVKGERGEVPLDRPEESQNTEPEGKVVASQSRKRKDAPQEISEGPSLSNPEGTGLFRTNLKQKRDATDRGNNAEESTGSGQRAVQAGSERCECRLAVPKETEMIELENDGVASQSRKRKRFDETPCQLCPDCGASFGHLNQQCHGIERADIEEEGTGSGNQVVETGRQIPPEVEIKERVSELYGMGTGDVTIQYKNWRPFARGALEQPCAPCPTCKASYQKLDSQKTVPSLLKQRREEEEEGNDYSWLDTYTHVIPRALRKLTISMKKSAFSFSDFGIPCEFGASLSGHVHAFDQEAPIG